jgi:hypothetical protein
MLVRKLIDLSAPYTIPHVDTKLTAETNPLSYKTEVQHRLIVIGDYVVLSSTDGCQNCSHPCVQTNELATVISSKGGHSRSVFTKTGTPIQPYDFIGFKWITGEHADEVCYGSTHIYANRFTPVHITFLKGVE